MSTVAWLLVIAGIGAIASGTLSLRAAGRKAEVLAKLPPPPVSAEEVAGLTAILTAAAQPGVPMPDIALAVLSEGYRKQQQGGAW